MTDAQHGQSVVRPGGSLRITQRSGPAGQIAPAEYLRQFEHSLTLPASSLAIDFLVRLGAERTGEAGVYSYSDPGRGSGVVRLEGFSATDAERIDDYFVVEGVWRELGIRNAPRQWVDIRTYAHLVPAARNPCIMVSIASLGSAGMLLCAALAVWGPLRVSESQAELAWLMPSTFLIIALLLLIVVVQHGRRLGPWLSARALLLSRGERLPAGLRWWE